MNLIKFPKIFALGHRHTKTIWEGPVEITEKIDGSQFSFANINGELIMRTKRTTLSHPSMVDKLFAPAVQHVSALFLAEKIPPNIIYFGETLMRPKHNVLQYNRVPKGHIVLFAAFDCNGHTKAGGTFLPHWVLYSEALAMEMDVVPLLFEGEVPEVCSGDAFRKVDELLQTESYLGGPKVEGIVIKNYCHDFLVGDQYFPIQCAKYVSEKFKEKHGKNAYGKRAKKQNWDEYMKSFRTEARWQKAVQHLRDDGRLLGDPKDIGALIKEVQADILEEEKEAIMNFLWNNFGKSVLKVSTSGLPEWYKEQLAKGEVEV